MIGGFLGSIRGIHIFVMRKCKTTCDAHYFLSQMAVTALRRYKRWIFRKKKLVRPLKLAIFLSSDDNNDITEDLNNYDITLKLGSDLVIIIWP